MTREFWILIAVYTVGVTLGNARELMPFWLYLVLGGIAGLACWWISGRIQGRKV